MPILSDKAIAKLLGLHKLPEYTIAVGVPAPKAERKDTGINNAELMYIHEYGAPSRGIPPRPVLQYTIEWMRTESLEPALIKALNAYVETKFTPSAFEKELKRYCMRVQNYARDLIYDRDPRLVPNKPATIKAKGSDLPLFDTGRLARSITALLLKSK